MKIVRLAPAVFPMLLALLTCAVLAAQPHVTPGERGSRTNAVAPVQGASGASPRQDGVSAPKRIVLGVVRSDGIMQPFASYNGKRWASRWPVEIGGRFGLTELPMNLDAIPNDWWDGDLPLRWRLWPTEDLQPRDLKPIAPVVTIVGISRRLGLRTDITPRPLPVRPFDLPFPKEGLAVAGDVEVQRIATVSRFSAEWKRFPDTIREQTNNAEERTIQAIRRATAWKHPFDRSMRAGTSAELEAWYASSLADGTSRVSYVEIVKKYPLLPEDKGCGLETFVSGWVHHEARREGDRSDLKAVVTYCDRTKVSYMLPFGQMRLRDRTYWVFQMSGHDHEWYEVAEFTPGRVRYVVDYQGGAAPADMIIEK